MRLLVLTNGAGEDSIARKILDRLSQSVQDSVVCCPLVGPGAALSEKYELWGPRVLPPSEGLFRESWILALKDLTQGVLWGHLRQLRFLRSLKGQVDLVVACGDLFPVIWAGLAGLGPLVFVGTAKSVYHHPYSSLERAILKRFAIQSIVRDGATAQRLTELGLKAEWHGNAMMDEVQPKGLRLPFHQSSDVITLFPGSRRLAPSVLPFQLEVVSRLSEELGGVQSAVAVAPGTELDTLVELSTQDGWTLETESSDGVVLGSLRRGDVVVYLAKGALGDLLHHSSAALGQAGTANEQAAGAGVPVVAYDPRGDKGLRWYRKRQKGLLGDSVAVVREDLETVVTELKLLLTDDDERERRAEIGIQRMGPPGGTQRMASAIESLWTRSGSESLSQEH